MPGVVDARQLDPVFERRIDVGPELNRPGRPAMHGGSSRNVPEVALRDPARLAWRDVAGDHERRVVGRVVGAEETAHVFERHVFEVYEADHNVCDLYARVVNVVVNFR